MKTHSLRPFHFLLASILLLIFAAQTALGSPLNSAAFDEEYHLGAGYAYLRTGDPRLSTEHPPLINVWNALPLAFLDPKLPLDSEAWQNAVPDDFGDRFLWQSNLDRAIPIVLLGRLPILFLGLLLGAIIFRFACDLFGALAALLALTLFAFDPNLIAQSRLSTTDLGLALTMTFAMWRMWRWLEKSTRRNLIILGLATGAAFSAKFTGLLLAPMFVVVAFIHPVKLNQTYGRAIVRRLLNLGVAGILGLIVVWAIYGFEIKDGLPAATYWHGLIRTYTELSPGLYPTFLLGRMSRTSPWYYFPLTFLLKTPLPTLLLCLIGIAMTIKLRSTRKSSSALIPPALSMAAALFSPLTIGYRHILPILPFVIVVAGNAVNLKLQVPSFRWQVASGKFNRQLRFGFFAILIAWLIIGALSIFPFHLSYFNELIGGMANAHTVLVDSNLDWGQDLPALKTWMSQSKVARVNLAYFGTALPAAYGINYWPLPAFLHFVTGPEVDAFNPYAPEPGWYAISATSLRLGLIYHDRDLYQFFRDRRPDARAGHSILLYRVDYPPNTFVDRAVIVGIPAYAFSAQQLGYTPGHRLIVKWSDNPDALIFAMEGSARYFLADRFPFGRELRDALRSAGQTSDGALIVDARPVIEARLSLWQTDTLHLMNGSALNWPINFDGKLELIGARLKLIDVLPGGDVDLTTYWRVIGELDPSLQMFVHVADSNDRLLAQYDGWQTAIRGLENGDVIAQRTHIPIPIHASAGLYSVRLGLYSADSLARYPLRLPIGLTGDQVVVSSIEIH